MASDTFALVAARRRAGIVGRLALLSSVMFTLVSFLGPNAAHAKDAIILHGSDTMLILNREWAAAYAERSPSLKINVVGGGSGRGIDALIGDEADIAAASRPIKESELEAFRKTHDAPPREYVVAIDGIGVYVHSNNPVSSLTVDQLRDILSGRITNWSEVGGRNRRIDVYNRDRFSGTRAFVQDHVLGDRSFTPYAQEVATTSMMTAAISRNQSAIGYGGIAYCQGAHIIRLAPRAGQPSVWPSKENVSAGRYPLSRPLYFYVNPAVIDDDLQAFVDWVVSPAGQRIVTFVGYYPIPKESRDDRDETGRVTSDAERESDAEAPAGPVVLTAANAGSHGFRLSVTMSDADVEADAGRAKVRIRFDPRGRAIDDIRRIELRIGDDAIVPLTLDPNGAAEFTLRRILLDDTTVAMSRRSDPKSPPDYVVELEAFVPDGSRSR